MGAGLTPKRRCITSRNHPTERDSQPRETPIDHRNDRNAADGKNDDQDADQSRYERSTENMILVTLVGNPGHRSQNAKRDRGEESYEETQTH